MKYCQFIQEDYGILSGDHLKSASDLGLPFVAVGLLYKTGYFHQKINGHGVQETEYKNIDLYNLPIKQFKYKDNVISETDARYEQNILGFIAEDVAEIYEPAVQYDEKGQVEMWNAQVIIPAILKLIQDLKKRVDVIESEVS